MNVKAGCCAVLRLGCSVLPWKQGGSWLQQDKPFTKKNH